jgi:hypothetical protein
MLGRFSAATVPDRRRGILKDSDAISERGQPRPPGRGAGQRERACHPPVGSSACSFRRFLRPSTRAREGSLAGAIKFGMTPRRTGVQSPGPGRADSQPRQLCGSMQTTVTELSAMRPDHLRPLFGVVCDAFQEGRQRAGNRRAARSASRALILGSARAALISLLSLSTISAGVFLGVQRPNHPLAS